DIDRFWHMHILDTRKYAADCEASFGHFVHHFPYLGLRGEEDAQALQAAFLQMQALYVQEFGEPAPVPRSDAAWCSIELPKTAAAWCSVESPKAVAAWCSVESPKAAAAWCSVESKEQAVLASRATPQSAHSAQTRVRPAFLAR
ncbi:MAG TPA: hypothetical protein VLJ86_23450, partial [Ramlibacter sp.]|nr:hypothetical protein [Ramlibacter sp.]